MSHDTREPRPIVIIPARITDAEAIAQVHIDSRAKAYRGIYPDNVLDNLSLDQFQREWQGALESPTTKVLLAIDQGKIVGFIAFGPSDQEEDDSTTTGEIKAMYLLPEYQQRGVGTELAAQAFEEMKANGFQTCILWCLEANTAGRKFYEDKLGMTLTGERRDYKRHDLSRPQVEYRKIL